MSALAQAAAQAVATPVPSPQVIVHTITNTIQVLPASVQQLLSLALLAGTGYAASLAHQLAEGGKNWSSKVNVALLFAYSAGLAVLDLFLQHKLAFGNWQQIVQDGLTVFGAASARYNVYKLLTAKRTAAPANVDYSTLPRTATP